MSSNNNWTRTWLLSLAAVTGFLLAAPLTVGAAAPGTAGVSGSALVFQAAPGTSNIVEIGYVNDATFPDAQYRVRDSGTSATPLGAGPGCSQHPDGRAICSGQLVEPKVRITQIRVQLGDGHDSLSFVKLNPFGAVPAATIGGGLGNDRIAGAEGPDVITAGPGVNTVRGLGGDDRLLLRNGRRDALIDCGEGTDVAVVDRNDPVAVGCETVQKPAS